MNSSITWLLKSKASSIRKAMLYWFRVLTSQGSLDLAWYVAPFPHEYEYW